MTAKGKSRGQNWSEHETQAVILVKDWLLFLTQSTRRCIVLHNYGSRVVELHKRNTETQQQQQYNITRFKMAAHRLACTRKRAAEHGVEVDGRRSY